MLANYCSKCGLPTYYTLHSPNVCSNCGNSFNSIASVKPPAPTKTVFKPTFINWEAHRETEKQYANDEDGKYEVISHVPEIDNLEVEIDSISSRRQPLASVAKEFYQQAQAAQTAKPQKKAGRPAKKK